MGSLFSKNQNSLKNAEKNFLNDEITEGYFNDLQAIFIHNYTTNNSLVSNMKVCLDEKNFDQILREESVTDNQTEDIPIMQGYILEPTDFINWLDYLYTYLEDERNKNRPWAGQLLDKLDQEYFLSENKYLSQFFYEEYGLLSIPDCIFKKSKREKKINVDTSMLNVTQNLGGSFGDSFNQFDNESDAGYKYKETRTKVKGYIKNFKEHILNEDHPINIVAQLFESVWVEYAKKQLNDMKNTYGDPDENNKKKLEEEINELTYQFQKFMIKLQICLKLFYSRTINYSFFTEEKDELINLTTTLVFRTGNIYDTMFSIYAYSLTEEISEMSKKYQKLKMIKPEDLGISPQFCLNSETLDLQEQILQKKLKEVNGDGDEEDKNKDITNSLEKGMLEIDISEKNLEVRKIKTMLGMIQDKKNRIPKPGQRIIGDTEVNLNFEDEISDDNDINLNGNLGKNDSVLIESNNILIGSIFPKSEINDFSPSANVSVDNAHFLKRPSININNDSSEYLINNNNVHNNIITTSSNADTNTKKINIDKKDYLFSKKPGIESSEETNDPNLIIRDINIDRKNVMPFIPEKIIGRLSFMRQNKDDFLSYPYETAILLLKQIEKYKTPFEKMMIIASISNEITDCINDFWQEMEEYIKKDFLGIEAEQIMTIFIYIIIKSGITDIFVHCKMIKLFTTCITKSSMIGYYYSTVEASIMYIRTLKNVEELFKNKGINKVFGD